MTTDLTIRSASTWNEVESGARLASRAFRSEHQTESFFRSRTIEAPALPIENTILAYQDEQLVGQLQIYQRRLRIGSGEVPFGAIGNVAVDPRHQDAGIGTQLLDYTKWFLNDNGYPASILLAGPALESFYGHRGWESVTFPLSECSQVDTPNATAQSFRPFSLEADFSTLRELYRSSAGNRPGSVVRSEAYWRQWCLDPEMAISHPDFVKLYQPTTTVTGYLIYKDRDSALHLLEHGYRGRNQRDFRQAVWDYLANRTDTITWHPPTLGGVDRCPAGAVSYEQLRGRMVQVHDAETITSLSGLAINSTTDLVEILGTDDFYWSPVDAF